VFCGGQENGGLRASVSPLLELQDLDEQVSGHARGQHAQHHPQLDVDADQVLQDVGEDETEGLPQAVVGKGRLLVLLEENAIQS